jgi:hypothetical protein
MELLDAYRTKEAVPPERAAAAPPGYFSVASQSYGAEEAPEHLAGYLGRIGRAPSSPRRRSWTSPEGLGPGKRGPGRA